MLKNEPNQTVGNSDSIFPYKPKTIFVCPWFCDKEECPREQLLTYKYYEENPYVIEPEINCNKSPIVFIDDGRSICKLVIDLANPSIKESLNNIGTIIKFRSI